MNFVLVCSLNHSVFCILLNVQMHYAGWSRAAAGRAARRARARGYCVSRDRFDRARVLDGRRLLAAVVVAGERPVSLAVRRVALCVDADVRYATRCVARVGGRETGPTASQPACDARYL